MPGLAVLLKNDLKLFLSDWKALLLLLLLPVLMIGFFAYALAPYINKTNFVEPFDIAIVDREDTAQTRMMINQFSEIELFNQIIPLDYDTAVGMIDKDELAGAVVIPEGFTASIARGENKPLVVIGNKRRPLQSYIIKNLMMTAANLVSSGQSAIEAVYRYGEKAGLEAGELNEGYNESTTQVIMQALARHEVFVQAHGSSAASALTPAEYYTAALISIFLMFAGMPGIKLLLTEKKLGLAARLRASPIRSWQIVLSKFTVSVILCLIQFCSIIIFTAIVFNNYWGAPVRSIIMVFGSVLFAVSAWSVFVSAVAKTAAAADALGYLGVLLMAVIGGCIYPIASMPAFIRALSGITISKWSMQGFMTLFSGQRTTGAVTGVYELLIIGAAFLVLALVGNRLQRRV